MVDIFFEEDQAVQAELREAYLALWTDYETPDRLQQAWRLAEPLAMLHQAVSYDGIIANLEPSAGQGLLSALPFFLRKTMTITRRLIGEPEHV
jgi:hypothetical protein